MRSRTFKSYLIFVAIAFLAVLAIIFTLVSAASANTETQNETKKQVQLSNVNIDEGFIHNYIKLVICQVIPTAINRVETDPKGGIYNLKAAAKWHKEDKSDPAKRPAPQGEKYVDSDVHKILESMCLALDTPNNGDQEIIKAQNLIKEKLNEWLKFYPDAQEPQKSQDPKSKYPGYFNSYYSLVPEKDEPNPQGITQYDKYSVTFNHELYCQGHFMEAAVAHYRYSKHENPNNPDTTLFDMAIKSADHIAATFGTNPGQRKQIPSHEEIELALVKLAKLCQEIGGEYVAKADTYIKTAQFFLDVRGDHKDRTVDDTDPNVDYRMSRHVQDLKPVSEQTEAVGHAVRAQYLYTGMCEVATIDSEYAAKYDKALSSLKDDIANKKQYVTGGVGDSIRSLEDFDEPYVLPNYLSYCETCAGVANMMFNRSMSTLYDGSQFADQIEIDLYNNVLGCINFDGNKFYYENRINTNDAFERQDWYGTACCPPNFTRTILQLGAYIYNTTSDDIYVNQYISNKADFNVGDKSVNINMNSNFPYETNGKMTVSPQKDAKFNLQLRKPAWANSYEIKVDGKTHKPQEKDGYLIISKDIWASSGTKIEFSFDKSLKYVKTDPKVESNKGLLAIQWGPIYYCAEACDNKDFDIAKASVTQNGKFNFEKVDSLDGKPDPFGVRSVYVLNHEGKKAALPKNEDITWKFVPYYSRCNRDLGKMRVFVFDGEECLKTHLKAKPFASFTSKARTDSVEGLNNGEFTDEMRWTSWSGDNQPIVQNPWVEYDFDQSVCFNGFRIYWYDDNGGVRLPDSFKVTLFNKQKESSEEIIVNNIDNGSNGEDKFKTYMFDKKYNADTIRMTLNNEKIQHAVGIVEWELIDATPDPPGPTPGPTPPGPTPGPTPPGPSPEPTPSPAPDPTPSPTPVPVNSDQPSAQADSFYGTVSTGDIAMYAIIALVLIAASSALVFKLRKR